MIKIRNISGVMQVISGVPACEDGEIVEISDIDLAKFLVEKGLFEEIISDKQSNKKKK